MENKKLAETAQRLIKSLDFLKFEGIFKYEKDINPSVTTPESLSRAKKSDPKYLTKEFLKRYADFYELSNDWLSLGIGEMTNKIPDKIEVQINYEMEHNLLMKRYFKQEDIKDEVIKSQKIKIQSLKEEIAILKKKIYFQKHEK